MSPGAAIIALSVFAAALLVLAGLLLVGKRRSPEEKERARRRYVSARGRVIDAEITDVQGDHIGYSYQAGGVTYHVVQDLGPFHDLLPRDLSLLLGPALIKYSPGNPANSVLISEEWSGIRIARPAPPSGAISKSKGA